jgi:hypothetical protein
MTGTEGSSITVTWGAACLGVAEATALPAQHSGASRTGRWAAKPRRPHRGHSARSVTTVITLWLSGFRLTLHRWTQAGDTELADAAAGTLARPCTVPPRPIGTCSRQRRVRPASGRFSWRCGQAVDPAKAHRSATGWGHDPDHGTAFAAAAIGATVTPSADGANLPQPTAGKPTATHRNDDRRHYSPRVPARLRSGPDLYRPNTHRGTVTDKASD